MKRLLRLVVVMVGLFAFYSCGSAPPPPLEEKAPNMKPVYNAIGNAFTDNQTIEVHIINDKYQRSFTSPNDPDLRYSNRYAPLSKTAFAQAVASIKKVFGLYFPNKTISFTGIDYSNADDYRTNVIQRETGSKLVVLFTLSSLDAHYKFMDSESSKYDLMDTYSGIDFYNASLKAWLAPPGKLIEANKHLSPLKNTYPSQSIFQILGTAEETDKDRQARSLDMFLQNIEPKLTDIFSLIGLQPEVASVVKPATAPIAPAPTVVKTTNRDPNLSHKWYALDPTKSGTDTNMLIFEFLESGKINSDFFDSDATWKAENGKLKVFPSSVDTILYSYAVNGTELKLDSTDESFGTEGYHKTLYRKAD
jgi:hypothetical protein